MKHFTVALFSLLILMQNSFASDNTQILRQRAVTFMDSLPQRASAAAPKIKAISYAESAYDCCTIAATCCIALPCATLGCCMENCNREGLERAKKQLTTARATLSLSDSGAKTFQPFTPGPLATNLGYKAAPTQASMDQ